MTKLDQFLNANEERAKFERYYDRLIETLSEIEKELDDPDDIRQGFMMVNLEEIKQFLNNKKMEVCGG